MAARAETSEAIASAGAVKPPQVKLPVAMLLVVVVLGVFVAFGATGGGFYFLMKSGRLPLGPISGAGAASPVNGAPGHPMVLEPILVNLADPGGQAYLRLGLTLDLEGDAAKPEGGQDTKAVKVPGEQEVAARDTVLAVLGQQTSAWLLGPDGKEHLKIELKEALAKHNAQLKVKGIFFTDFLVQI